MSCPHDTDGDGDCGRIGCPYCGGGPVAQRRFAQAVQRVGRANRSVETLTRELDRRGQVVAAVQIWRQQREWNQDEGTRHLLDRDLERVIDGYSAETIRQNQGVA